MTPYHTDFIRYTVDQDSHLGIVCSHAKIASLHQKEITAEASDQSLHKLKLITW